MPDDVNDPGSVTSSGWRPIEDLQDDWRDLCRPDLHGVYRQWVADRKLIRDPQKVDEFRAHLYMLWAIETGVVERLYAVDRGVTKALLERDLIEDQRDAVDFILDYVSNQRELTLSYIKELHNGLTAHQDYREVQDRFGNIRRESFLRGEWKKRDNFPTTAEGLIDKYCPPEQVQGEMERLLELNERHADVCPEVRAAWLHHRFTQIHPFDDGNGRVARALASAIFLQADHLVLIVRGEKHREVYFDALEAADEGDLGPLVNLFADIQIGDLNDGLRLVRSLRGEETVKAVEEAAVAARQSQDATMVRIATTLDELAGIAALRMEEVAAETQRAFESQGVVVSTYVSGDEERRDWWHRQIVKAAKAHGYFADLDRPRRWVSLRLGLPAREGTDTGLVVSLHGVGRRVDQHAVTAFLTERPEEGAWDTHVVAREPFLFDAESTTDEALEEKKAEFRVWLDAVIPAAVRSWAERL